MWSATGHRKWEGSNKVEPNYELRVSSTSPAEAQPVGVGG
jgi:hypothetical protein